MADGVPLNLPEGHRHFRPLVSCWNCSQEFAGLKARIKAADDPGYLLAESAAIVWRLRVQRRQAKRGRSPPVGPTRLSFQKSL